MPSLRIRKPRRTAPATVIFGQAVNEDRHKQICIWTRCDFSGVTIGPIWSHTDAAIRRALATLTQYCDCPATYHKARDYEGHRVMTDLSSQKRPR
jgi:hypothetical protein